jgi:hypothetical protein
MRLYLEQALSSDERHRLTEHLHPGPVDAVDGSDADREVDDGPRGDAADGRSVGDDGDETGD